MPANINHQSFKDRQPCDTNIKIWRYMDFTKYVSMLSKNSLFFPSIDELDDPFEGSITCMDKVIMEIILKNKGFTQEDINKISSFREFCKKLAYLNCWHMNEHESAAMWKLYAKTNDAIAIQSTYNLLRNMLPSDTYIGLIKYIDYETDSFSQDNFCWNFMHKRKCFEHEKEIRCLKLLEHDPNNRRLGIEVDVSLKDLIQNVYVSPLAPPWLTELTKNITQKYGFEFNIIQSSLSKKPLF